MPIYEYAAEQCGRQPACSRKKEYKQRITDPALSECPDCGVPIRRVMSTFAARSGSVGGSSPDPTPLNMTGIKAPSGLPGGEGGCSHDH
jgi:putative FmdB family regulatory protein